MIGTRTLSRVPHRTERIRVSYKLVDNIFDSDVVGGMTKFVLQAFARHANDDGSECYPAISTIAVECGITRHTVYDHLNLLLEAGILTDTGREKNWGRGHKTVIYQIETAKLTYPDDVNEIDSVQTVHRVQSTQKQCANDALHSVQSPDATLSFEDSVPASQTQSMEWNGRERKGSGSLRSPMASSATDSSSAGSLTFKEAEAMFPESVSEFLSLWSDLTMLSVDPKDFAIADAILKTLNGSKHNEHLVETVSTALKLWDYNQIHAKDKYKLFSLKGMLAALQSDSERYNLMNQFRRHESSRPTCKTCKMLRNHPRPVYALIHQLEEEHGVADAQQTQNGRSASVGCSKCGHPTESDPNKHFCLREDELA